VDAAGGDTALEGQDVQVRPVQINLHLIQACGLVLSSPQCPLLSTTGAPVVLGYYRYKSPSSWYLGARKITFITITMRCSPSRVAQALAAAAGADPLDWILDYSLRHELKPIFFVRMVPPARPPARLRSARAHNHTMRFDLSGPLLA
jgi:hypothetical protein